VSDERYCLVHVGDLLLGVEVGRVQEVLGDVPVTPVPLADASVTGLLNLRGRIVTAVDARTRLGLPSREEGQSVANVVMTAGGETVSLVVDAEEDVVDVDGLCREQVPETVSSTIRAFVTGCYQLDERLLLVLDADRALTLTATT
jgi:purine-binding chemotaxis protein CheW